MSWAAILLLAGGAYGFKLAGVMGLGRFFTGERAAAIGALLPPALLFGLVVVQTFAIDTETGVGLALDARAAGVAAGAIAVWRKISFVGVVVIAAVVTGGIRALS